MTDRLQGHPVSAWEETVVIPTYPAPTPEPNPMFFEKRVNQGASGRVYPNPVTDRVSDQKMDRSYQMVFLENEYLQVMVLPELGGRIFAGMDKSNDYDFFYRQHVIKPALIGLLGSWISGGVEFNWPQHHRPSTFMPVDHIIEEGADGSRTVWLSEHEPMERTKGMVGICLHPGKAFVETKVRIFNRTPFPRTFLWWENTAVHATEGFQVFFPPDVSSVTYHTRQFMAAFPVARGLYHGLDFGEGTDISWYRNIPLPTSYFANESRYDFFGGYDHGREAGVINIGNHHIAPGKKMFTWGNGEFGKAWERNLTDADGPYLELMAGVYTDNQPDFSWLQPYEAKVFSQYWYPIQKIGPAVAANLRVALSLGIEAKKVRVGICSTEVFEHARISLAARDLVLLESEVDLAPGAPLVEEAPLPAGVGETDLLVRVLDGSGHELIRYTPVIREEKPLPEPANVPPLPHEAKTTEELYLTGLHIEQYRHATWDPEPYWQEALRRDPGDVRSNNALGLALLRRGEFAQAEERFRRAIKTQIRYNFNPYDGEPYYNLGLALKYQGRLDEAYAAFYKGIWSYAWQSAGYYALAEIDCRRTDFATALDHLSRSQLANGLNQKARNLRAAALRHLGRYAEAEALARETVAMDPLDFWARNEMVLASRAAGAAPEAERRLRELSGLMRDEAQTYLDIAYDYAGAGLWDEASDLLARLVDPDSQVAVYPMLLYSLGYFAGQRGQAAKALEYYLLAAKMPPDYCFPVRLEEMSVLRAAQAANPADAKAPYYLGNLLYDKRRYEEAIRNWETSTRLDPGFSTAWRNLGMAYYNIRRDPERARACYEKAFRANRGDPRLLCELDQLMKRQKTPPAERLAFLEGYLDLVERRDDLYVERVALYNELGQPQRALDLLRSHRFHPWEGGEGLVARQYDTAHFLLGRTALETGAAEQAQVHFEAARHYPENLGVARFRAMPEAHLHYYAGLAREALGDRAGAEASWRAVVEAKDGFSHEKYYQALAWRKLGDGAAAGGKLQELLDTASQRMEAEVKTGYFENYLPNFLLFEDDLKVVNRVECLYLIGLARLGLGQVAEARQAFQELLALDINHIEAREELRRLPANRS
jgi:tetratricopeptide (TPR) repeat protein